MRNFPHDEYNALLARIVKGAEYLDNPLIKTDDHAKGMKLYDDLVEQLIKMRR